MANKASIRAAAEDKAFNKKQRDRGVGLEKEEIT